MGRERKSSAKTLETWHRNPTFWQPILLPILAPESSYRADPLVGHDLVAAVGRMDAVPNPVLCWRPFTAASKACWKCTSAAWCLSASFATICCRFWIPSIPRCPVSLLASNGQTEWFAQHEFYIGVGRLDRGKKLVVDPFVLVKRNASSVVVDANQHAQQIGLQIECVVLPTFLQIKNGVAADAAVHEVQVPTQGTPRRTSPR